MGKLFYDGDQVYEIPDRTLLHVQLAITSKLRRQEQFTLSWQNVGEPGPTTIWLSGAIALRFVFDGPTSNLKINRDWLEAMIDHATHNSSLAVIAEPI
jgi:hypothetical protein